MSPAAHLCFRMGIPSPIECKLTKEINGIGSQRQCKTNRGFINQRITEWNPPHRLVFITISDTVGIYKNIENMEDTFILEPQGEINTQLTRITKFETKGSFKIIKRRLFKMTVKRLHKYVMEEFKTLAEKQPNNN